ncbi:MAG: lysine--tRNA ligase [Deltaproteobacteria bacterium]|nr:lysine--tRNA ligase [Deltaproteobacteria bacterium]
MYENCKSWPFQEAASLKKSHSPFNGKVLFETGFGPSGLPHIGTFAEVARTTWVRKAFEKLTGLETELVAFSDDMDGLRKVPTNLPQKEMLNEHLGKPLSSIPDPFGCCESFSAHMNKKLCEFLDAFGFEYRFQSSSEAYKRGDFNGKLLKILELHEAVRQIIIPTLREENRADWSPFMPICPNCGRVYTTRVTDTFPERGTLSMVCDRSFGDVSGCGHEGEISVTDGNAKVGWKIDWALRWASYGISYEMYGKDLIESAKLSAKVCRKLDSRPPAGLFYEMFLDENGEKISKSVGKGLTVDSWMEYAPIESLLYYIWQNPKKAKRLFFGMIPKVVDDYLGEITRFPASPVEKQPDMAIWHVYEGEVPAYDSSITFSVVNNLVSAVGGDDRNILNEYLLKYDEKSALFPETINAMLDRSLSYYRDFIVPTKKFIMPQGRMLEAFRDLHEKLVEATKESDVDSVHSIPFDVAKEHEINPPELFTAFYQAILGQDRGPRFGAFAKLVGLTKLAQLLEHVINHD